jgi:hypothetical protein
MQNTGDNMQELRAKLELAFDAFAAIQSDMEDLLLDRPEAFPDKMEQWISSYRRAAANLQFLLDAYRENLDTGSDLEEASRWQKKLGQALNRQDNIYSLLEKVRHDLASRLREMKSGKNALSGYHSGTGVDKPVFISREA